jgi:hypothetical protein
MGRKRRRAPSTTGIDANSAGRSARAMLALEQQGEHHLDRVFGIAARLGLR